MRKILFILPLGISLAAMSCSSNPEETATTIQQEKESRTIDVVQFEKLINQEPRQILDVRTPEEWAEGTIKDAQKMNFFDTNFQEQLDQLDKKKPVFVYCKSGGRSGQAAKQLETKGFIVYNLSGGITAWKAAGKSTTK